MRECHVTIHFHVRCALYLMHITFTMRSPISHRFFHLRLTAFSKWSQATVGSAGEHVRLHSRLLAGVLGGEPGTPSGFQDNQEQAKTAAKGHVSFFGDVGANRLFTSAGKLNYAKHARCFHRTGKQTSSTIWWRWWKSTRIISRHSLMSARINWRRKRRKQVGRLDKQPQEAQYSSSLQHHCSYTKDERFTINAIS